MRVHTCRHCGEVFPSYPDLRQHLDSHLHHLSAIYVGHVKSRSLDAPICLNTQAYVCNVCHSSFGRRWALVRHDRTIRCGGPKEPESAPKRRKIVEYLHEDTAICTRCCTNGRRAFRRITRSHSHASGSGTGADKVQPTVDDHGHASSKRASRRTI